MRLIRYQLGDSHPRLGVTMGEGVYDVTEVDESFADISSLLRRRAPVEESIGRLREAVAKQRPVFDVQTLVASGHGRVGDQAVRLLKPIDHQEVWAAGVTYKRSEEARMAESQGAAAFYAKVYESDRPELFLKATPHRAVGAYEEIGIRADSSWNVPEPELGVVLTERLEVLGYTVGNDMSSRSIEGENPLYLPQAKVYTRCLSVGPWITLVDEVPEPHSLGIALRILRAGALVFAGSISTSQMHRRVEELVAYLGRANSFPHGVVLLTGTGIVPDDDFTLQADDVVEIEIERIGLLTNRVCTVGVE